MPLASSPLTPEVWGALLATSSDPIVVDYKITEKDVKGPFLKKLPAKMEDMKDLKSLGYTSPREAIAEKFHMSEALLAALNPGKKFDEAGQTISVVNSGHELEADASKSKPARIFGHACRGRQDRPDGEGRSEIRRTDRLLSGERWKRREADPSGVLKVTSIDAQPNYRYNPDYKFKSVKSKKPSPSSPAPTTLWALTGSGFRRKATAFTARRNPSKVSKVGVARLRASHQLGRRQAGESSLKKGTEVAFIEREAAQAGSDLSLCSPN